MELYHINYYYYFRGQKQLEAERTVRSFYCNCSRRYTLFHYTALRLLPLKSFPDFKEFLNVENSHSHSLYPPECLAHSRKLSTC